MQRPSSGFLGRQLSMTREKRGLDPVVDGEDKQAEPKRQKVPALARKALTSKSCQALRLLLGGQGATPFIRVHGKGQLREPPLQERQANSDSPLPDGSIKSMMPDIFDYGINGQEGKCKTSFLRESRPRVHLPIGEASRWNLACLGDWICWEKIWSRCNDLLCTLKSDVCAYNFGINMGLLYS